MEQKPMLWVCIGMIILLADCAVIDTPTRAPEVISSSPTPENVESPTTTIESVCLDPPTSTQLSPYTQDPSATPTKTPEILSPTATATPHLFALPSPTQTPLVPSVTEPPVVGNPVVVYETTVTIQTYGYTKALQPTNPDDDIYPYPRLDREQVTPPQPESYKAIVMENDYVAIYILPELGGRIYRWVDKVSGRRLLYENPVIKPTEWGYRGWWLAAGGIEWAFPVEEHGLNEWRPWAYNISNTGNTAFVYVSDTEDRTGLEVGMTIILDSSSPVLMLTPRVRNNTATAQNFQYWLNGMLAFNDNRTSKNTEFILPASQVMVQSTGDNRFPGEWQLMTWPEYNGINVSFYGTWEGWLGFFVPNVSAGFTAVYDHEVEQGVVRLFTPGWPAGTKIFGPGTLPSWLWTDDDSNYIEFWSGLTTTFADDAVIIGGESISWTEYWYPVHDLGGVSIANEAGALLLSGKNEVLKIGATVIQGHASTLKLWQNRSPIQTWALSLDPGQTFSTTWATSDTSNISLSLLDAGGNIMVQTGVQNTH